MTLRKETDQVCRVVECDRPADGSKGYCWAHYVRWHRTGVEPTGPVAKQRAATVPCELEGCERTAKIGPLCAAHGRRVQRMGDIGSVEVRPLAGHNKGKQRWLAGNGYWWVRQPEHPNAYKNGTVQEHTVVMAGKLGRPLITGENVHHKNGIRSDNSPANLELWVNHQPKGQRATDLLVWARELIERYGDMPPESLG